MSDEDLQPLERRLQALEDRLRREENFSLFLTLLILLLAVGILALSIGGPS